MNNSGIYAIRNNVTGDRYIGSTVSFEKRWITHCSKLRCGKHHNNHLQRAWNKYDEKSFFFSPLVICSRDNLFMYEQLVLDSFKPEYNVSQFANSPRSLVLTDEHKQRIGNANRGKKRGPLPLSVRAKISRFHTGHVKSPETRARLSMALKGRTFSAETRKKMSIAALGSKRPRTAEHQDKLTASLIGRKLPPVTAEARDRMSHSQKMRRAIEAEQRKSRDA